jgi:hypothetical protein
MRNGVLFGIARAAALASTGGAQIIALAAATPVRADGPVDRPDAFVAPRPDTPRARQLEFLEEFWLDAWGEAFSLHESGMTLGPAGAGGLRALFAHDGSDTVASGHYQELARWAVTALSHPPQGPPSDGSFVFEHFVTAGLVEGATGMILPIYGLAQRVVFAADGADAIVVEGITPLGTAEGPGDAIAAALDLLALMEADPAFPDSEPPFDLDGDPCLCDEVFDTELSACLADSLGCQSTCAAAAIAALLACLASGPFAGGCAAAVLVAEALCITGCIHRERACCMRAEIRWLECWMDCAN